MTTLNAFGDSIVKGEAVSIPFPANIATAIGATLNNYGINGAQAADLAASIYATSITNASRSILAVGINDMRTSGGSASKRAWFSRIHACLCAWLCVSSKIQAPAVTASSGWALNNTYGSFNSLYSASNGATLDFNVFGSVIYLGLTATATGGSFRVDVDGVNKGTFSCNGGADIASYIGGSIAPFLVRIPGLSNSLHAVKITITSSSGQVFFDWAGTPDSEARCYVGSVTRMAASGYSAYGGSDAEVLVYDDAIFETVAMLHSDGLNTMVVNSVAVINPLTDLADGLHPTQSGYDKIAALFLSKMADVALHSPWEPNKTYTPTLVNGWSNIFATNNGFDPITFTKDERSRVFLSGFANGGSIGPNIAMYYLPEGFRPDKAQRFITLSNGGIGILDVFPSGMVSAQAGSNVYFNCSPASFLACR